MATGLRGTGSEIVDAQVVERAAGSLEDVDHTQLVVCSLDDDDRSLARATAPASSSPSTSANSRAIPSVTTWRP